MTLPPTLGSFWNASRPPKRQFVLNKCEKCLWALGPPGALGPLCGISLLFWLRSPYCKGYIHWSILWDMGPGPRSKVSPNRLAWSATRSHTPWEAPKHSDASKSRIPGKLSKMDRKIQNFLKNIIFLWIPMDSHRTTV